MTDSTDSTDSPNSTAHSESAGAAGDSAASNTESGSGASICTSTSTCTPHFDCSIVSSLSSAVRVPRRLVPELLLPTTPSPTPTHHTTPYQPTDTDTHTDNERTEPNTKSEAEPTNGRASRRKSTVSYLRLDGGNFDDADFLFDESIDEIDEAAAVAEAQREVDSAIACGLTHTMSDLEIQYLPEFVNKKQLYFGLRNVICYEWQLDVSRYLSCAAALRQVKSGLKKIAKRVYEFLDSFGFINVGLLNTEQTSKSKAYTNASASASGSASADIGQSTIKKKILIIGAGAAGLGAARQLRGFGHDVTVIEGRNRIGGRVWTNRDLFSGPIDFGASIITGLIGNPIATLCKQLTDMGSYFNCTDAGSFPELLHFVQSSTQLYTPDGGVVDNDLDQRVFDLYNRILAGTHLIRVNAGFQCPGHVGGVNDSQDSTALNLGSSISKQQLESWSIEHGMNVVKGKLNIQYNRLEELLHYWHVSNLEYGCAAAIDKISMVHWDQDDEYGWEGEHSVVRHGYGHIVERLGDGIDIRLAHKVEQIKYNDDGVAVQCFNSVTNSMEYFEGDLVLCTVSLGVLKANSIEFCPPLPDWKQRAIDRLGFGLLNKLVMEFDVAFWNDEDMFGHVAPTVESRGKFYIFWNIHRANGVPMLVALCTGQAAFEFETLDENALVDECFEILHSMYGSAAIRPRSYHCTRWYADEFARGSYSYIATGATGEDYDVLAKSVGDRLYFAGEATNRQYPATVPGALLSGVRMAGNIQAKCSDWFSRVCTDVDLFPAESTPPLHPSEGFGAVESAVSTSQSLAGKPRNRQRRGFRFQSIPPPVPEREEIEDVRTDHQIKLDPKMSKVRVDTVRSALLRGEKPLLETKTNDDIIVKDESCHIVKYAGPVEKAFVAQLPDMTGLPSLLSFHDFNHTHENHNGNESTASNANTNGYHERVSAHSRHSNVHSHSHSHSHSSSRRSDSKRKRSSHSSSHHKKEKHSHVRSPSKTKLVGSAGGVSSASSCHSNSKSTSERVASTLRHFVDSLLSTRTIDKQIHLTILKKATNKLIDDWNSKPRGSLSVDTWLNDKRTARIHELINKYMNKLSAPAPAPVTPPNASISNSNSNSTLDTRANPIANSSLPSTAYSQLSIPSPSTPSIPSLVE